MDSIRLVYIYEDWLLPDDYDCILTTDYTRMRLKQTAEREIRNLFKSSGSLHFFFRQTGSCDPYRGVKQRYVVMRDLDSGRLVGLRRSSSFWIPGINWFYIDKDGRLARAEKSRFMPDFEADEIIRLYEESVRINRYRPPPTKLPPKFRAVPDDVPEYRPPPRKTPPPPSVPLIKKERMAQRKALIAQGQQSDSRTVQDAASRLRRNNNAVEYARLSENVYGPEGQPINALQPMPGVPEGWRDISNDREALQGAGLEPEMLFDRKEEPDFFARVYAPDKTIFGGEMVPAVVFRGTRMSSWEDWKNNGTQMAGSNSEYYKKAVEIGSQLLRLDKKVAISGHSLGGGLASAAGMVSRQPTWTFNAGTVKKYGGDDSGDGSNILAYRVKGEILTAVQESAYELSEHEQAIHHSEPAYLHGMHAEFSDNARAVAELQKRLIPKAAGEPVTLLAGEEHAPQGFIEAIKSAAEKHKIGKVIEAIERQKDEDITTLRGQS